MAFLEHFTKMLGLYGKGAAGCNGRTEDAKYGNRIKKMGTRGHNVQKLA